MGVQVIGTIGLLIKAKQMGVVPLIRPLLDKLDACQFRVSTALREEALKRCDEFP